jgi:hypothetical protein
MLTKFINNNLSLNFTWSLFQNTGSGEIRFYKLGNQCCEVGFSSMNQVCSICANQNLKKLPNNKKERVLI